MQDKTTRVGVGSKVGVAVESKFGIIVGFFLIPRTEPIWGGYELKGTADLLTHWNQFLMKLQLMYCVVCVGILCLYFVTLMNYVSLHGFELALKQSQLFLNLWHARWVDQNLIN